MLANPRATISALALFLLGSIPSLAGEIDGVEHDVTLQSDIVYLPPEIADEYAKAQCKLDLYLPKSTVPFPLLVWFHGGALKGGSKTSKVSVEVAKSFARRGVGIVLADYRLNPAVTFPVYIQDGAQAVKWAVQNASQLKAKPQVYVGGHSAGGYIAALLAMNPSYLKEAGVAPESIAGFISMSGQTMTHFTVAEERGTGSNVITADDAAPIHYVRKEIPPLLLLVGDKDWPARRHEVQYFYSALKEIANSQNVSLFVIPERDHGGILKKSAEPADPAAEKILEFVRNGALPSDGSPVAAPAETSALVDPTAKP